MLPEPKISYKPFWGICRPLNSWRANSPNPIQIYCAQKKTISFRKLPIYNKKPMSLRKGIGFCQQSERNDYFVPMISLAIFLPSITALPIVFGPVKASPIMNTLSNVEVCVSVVFKLSFNGVKSTF